MELNLNKWMREGYYSLSKFYSYCLFFITITIIFFLILRTNLMTTGSEYLSHAASFCLPGLTTISPLTLRPMSPKGLHIRIRLWHKSGLLIIIWLSCSTWSSRSGSCSEIRPQVWPSMLCFSLVFPWRGEKFSEELGKQVKAEWNPIDKWTKSGGTWIMSVTPASSVSLIQMTSWGNG